MTTTANATTRSSNDSDSEAESAPLIDTGSSPHVDDNVNPESRARPWHVGAEIASRPTADDINVGTSTVTETSPDPIPFPDEGPNPDQLLFDFEGFLDGGSLDDVFGIPPDSTPKPNSTSDGGGWVVTKLRVNIVVRVASRLGDDGLGRNPSSAVIKYAPHFVAAMGGGAPFGTFRQASTTLPVIITRTLERIHPTSPGFGMLISKGVYSRSSNTEPDLCSGTRLASRLPRPRTELRSQRFSTTSKAIGC